MTKGLVLVKRTNPLFAEARMHSSEYTKRKKVLKGEHQMYASHC